MSISRSTRRAVKSRSLEQLAYQVDRLTENVVQLDMYLYFIEKALIVKGVATQKELDDIARDVKGLRKEDGVEETSTEPPSTPDIEVGV